MKTLFQYSNMILTAGHIKDFLHLNLVQFETELSILKNLIEERISIAHG